MDELKNRQEYMDYLKAVKRYHIMQTGQKILANTNKFSTRAYDYKKDQINWKYNQISNDLKIKYAMKNDLSYELNKQFDDWNTPEKQCREETK